jgi:hypothetical protein
MVIRYFVVGNTRGAIVIPLAIEFGVNLMIYFGIMYKKKNWSKKKQNGEENQDGLQA